MRRPPAARVAVPLPTSLPTAVAAVVVLIAVLAGCSDRPADRGEVPIPVPTPAAPITATPGRAAVLSMGDTVALDDSLVTASGPGLPTPPPGVPPPTSAPGSITVTARGAGTDLSPAAFMLRDELARPIPFALAPAGSGTVRITATLPAGQAALEWNPHGRPAASWEFQVELD